MTGMEAAACLAGIGVMLVPAALGANRLSLWLLAFAALCVAPLLARLFAAALVSL